VRGTGREAGGDGHEKRCYLTMQTSETCSMLVCFLVVDCGSLPNPPNGRVSLIATTFLSSANYFCDPTFLLVGFDRRICQGNGQWSGEEPSCLRE
jgi:hypothetical protein